MLEYMAQTPEIVHFDRVPVGVASPEDPDAQRVARTLEWDRVPTSPGCYIMFDAQDRVIYVGKAKNIRARLRSYVYETDSRQTVPLLMERVAYLDFLLTNTDKEALLLENSLIKKHKPRYNIRLKDDKTYVSVRVDVQHEFPRLTVTRKVIKDGSRYFGPYASASAVRDTLRQLQKLFPLRTCSDSVLRNRARPCLYYQMKQCAGPCVGHIDKDDYREIVEQVLLALEGRNADLEKRLTQMIKTCADRLEFEKAAELRDRLFALRRTFERQRTVDVAGVEERDVFGIHTHGRFSEIQVLFFRGAKMLGGRSFSFNQREIPAEEALSSFLLQYYSEAPSIPPEVLTPIPIEDADVLAEILSDERGSKVTVHCPQRGEKRALVDLASRNARSSFDKKRLAENANRDLLEQVRQTLQLPSTPLRVECFDISTTQGEKAVGSMVVFEEGVASRSRYRHYAIRSVEGQDDFAMMREILLRRYQRAIAENDLPDLVLIDGGKGQLGVAVAALKDLGIEDIGLASIAKARAQEGGRSPERFFIPGRLNPIIPRQDSPVVLFLARVRDEAHRFAITYHRQRRAKSALASPLLDIPGVGKKRAQSLLSQIGSIAKIRQASAETIAEVPGFSLEMARTIKEYLDRTQ